jgi:hypothetical protein
VKKVASLSAPTLRLANVIKQQRAIQQLIHQVISSVKPESAKIRGIVQNLERTVDEIERLCIQNHVTPAALAGPSRSAYAWMKFLSDEDNLQLHLRAAHRASQIVEEIVKYKRQDVGKVIVELTNYEGLYKYSSSPNLTTIVLSEGFIQASDDVLRAAIASALLGKSQQTTQVIKKFGISQEYSDVLLELDLIVQAITETAKGNCYDLDALFEAVNQEYFAGQMVKPRLSWNRALTRRKFGHYERARDRVVMSLTLDNHRVPQFVVEFVLYHELLHKHHGSRWVNGRRMSHTAEFRRSEQQFKFYEEAHHWLSRLASGEKKL